MKKAPGDIKSILVMNLGGIGDQLYSIPALRALRKLYPSSRISLLAIPRSQEITGRLSGLVDACLMYKGAWSFMRDKRKGSFDLVINMRSLASRWGAFKIWILFFLIGARQRAGRDTQGRGFFLNIKLSESDIAVMHDVDYNLNLAGLLGADTADKRIELTALPQDKLFVEEFLRQNQVGQDDCLVAINPLASWQSKCWPLDNFAKVIDGLAGQAGCRVVITGTNKDIPAINRLKFLSKTRLLISAGKTSPGQLIALLDKCNLLITNDGAPMHIASILKRPFIALFGPSDTKRFGPYQPYKQGVVLSKNLGCSPCFRKRCRRLDCLRSIRPEEVLSEAMRALNENLKNNRG